VLSFLSNRCDDPFHVTNETDGDETGFLPGFEVVGVSVGMIVVAVWWRRKKRE